MKKRMLLSACLMAGMVFGVQAMAVDVYTITDGTSYDYSYTTYDGTTTEYKKININPAGMTTSSNITWTKSTKEGTSGYNWSSSAVPSASYINPVVTDDKLQSVDGAVRFYLSHNGTTETQYYIYNFTNPNSAYDKHTRIGNFSSNITANDHAYFYRCQGYSGPAGAIYNTSTYGYSIIADFIQSNAHSGGAIYNIGTISHIDGDFIKNIATGYLGHGGAIYNTGEVSSITGDFLANDANYYGGAIYNTGEVSSITGDFLANNASYYGGAIYNTGTISSIAGNFIGNSIVIGGNGGAIYNTGTISSIKGDFIGNSSRSRGGTIYNSDSAQVENIVNSSFISNDANAFGGAIFNANETSAFDKMMDEWATTTVEDTMTIYFSVAENSEGSLVYINHYKGTNNWDDVAKYYDFGDSAQDILDSFGLDSFDEWTLLEHVALYNGYKNINDYVANETGYASMEALLSAYGLQSKEQFKTLHKYMLDFGITNRDYIAQYAGYSNFQEILTTYGLESEDDITQTIFFLIYKHSTTLEEAAIAEGYTPGSGGMGDITFSGINIFTNNKANGEYNDITNDGKITLAENALVISNSGINGTKDTGTIIMNSGSELRINNYLKGQTVNMDNSTISLGSFNQLDGTTTHGYLDLVGLNVSANGGTINAINNMAHTHNVGALNLTGNLNFTSDVDLAAEKMDRLTATSVTGDGKINVVGMNIVTDATKESTSILFADENLRGKVVNKVDELGNGVENEYQTTAFSPIYKYDVSYNPENGNFTFAGGPSGGGEFNPAVISEPAVAQANVMAATNIVNNYAFHSVDTTSMSHSHGRLSSRYLNRYAIAEEPIKDDLNTNNPLFLEPEGDSVWFKPFASFENIPLRNGPKVNSTTYGALLGYDSKVFNHKHGWDGVWTGYVGYTGATTHYTGVDSISNGGLMGATYSLYKGGFFNATTLTAGAMLDQVNTMYGKDNLTTLYAGVGNKTGYNWGFKDGLFVIQPSILLSYTFANTFDYTNAAGVRIDSDPLHTIQISPGIKFFMNTKNGWQPYIGVNMMWNIMGNTHTKANGVQLPEMSVKPYIQYGIGLQKVMKDHFTAYGQAMLQNGGRNGISLTAGFKWAIGRDKKKPQTVQTNGVRTVIK